MTTSAATPPTTATLLAAEPQLFARDLDAAREFYTAKLGFQVAFAYGEPTSYLQVVRGGARLNIRHADGPVFADGFREREPDALAATLVLDDAGPLFLELQAKGVAFHQPLRDEPWGARTFIVADPDGNLLCFAGR
jgi:catechol 2,3-dioxygenase-like lactoylglutathione lyase family enzyme